MSFVAVDWGSTRFRAYRVEPGGVSERISSGRGILSTAPAELAGTLVAELAPWRAWIERERVPVSMIGMIGSNRGLRDTGYQRLPVDFDTLASAEAELEVATPLATKVGIRTGIAYVDAGTYDVMRGEDVLLLGAQRLRPAGLYVFPGTHSKWVPVEVRAGRPWLRSFTTVMTGELYAWLVEQSLVCRGIPTERAWNEEAFWRGVAYAIEEGDLFGEMFRTRARWLLGDLAPEAAPSYLSGLLIGHEVATRTRWGKVTEPLVVVGEGRLCGLYASVLSHIGVTAEVIDEEAALVAGFGRMRDAR